MRKAERNCQKWCRQIEPKTMEVFGVVERKTRLFKKNAERNCQKWLISGAPSEINAEEKS